MRKRSHVVLPLFLGSVFVYAAYATWRTENLHRRHQRYAYALGAIRALGLEADARPGAVSRVPVENTSNASATWRAKHIHRRHMPNQQHAHAPGTPRVVFSTSSSGQKNITRVAVTSSKNSSVSLVKRPKIVYLLHLHKSGGTSVCSAAKASGLHVDKRNCNVQADQRCCGGETIAEQQQFARNTGYNFVACESYMYAEMDLEYYIYVITLRNSMARYMSHYNHVMRARQTESFDAWLSGQPDNWNVRHICGSRCMQVPKFALSSDDFYVAARRLSRFSHILFHETLRQSFDAMVHKLKWKNVRLHHDQASPKPYMYAHANWTLMTCLDDLLYAKAKQNTLLEILPSEVDALIKVMNANVTKYKHPCGTSCSRYR